MDRGNAEERNRSRKAFKEMGSAVVPVLVKHLTSDRSAPWLIWEWDFKRLPGKVNILKMTAATALGELGSDAQVAIPKLRILATDQNPWVSGRAKAALLKIEGKDLKEISQRLAAVSPSANWGDLDEILMGLGDTAKPLIPLVARLALDQNPNIAGKAATLLGDLRLEPESAISALRSQLSSTNDNVRFMAATALREYGILATNAVDELIVASKDKWDYVTVNALGTIEKFAETPYAQKAVPTVNSLLTHQTDYIRESARRTLNKIHASKHH